MPVTGTEEDLLHEVWLSVATRIHDRYGPEVFEDRTKIVPVQTQNCECPVTASRQAEYSTGHVDLPLAGGHRPPGRHTACAHANAELLLSTDIRTPPRLRRPYIVEAGQSQRCASQSTSA